MTRGTSCLFVRFPAVKFPAMLCGIIIAACACPADTFANSGKTVVPVDGHTFDAQLRGISSAWNLQLDDGNDSRDVHAADMVVFGAHSDTEKGPQILLADGGVLVADLVEITSEFISIESNIWLESKIPLELVRGIVLRPPLDAKGRDQLDQEVRLASGGTDVLVLENGDRIGGLLVPAGGSTNLWTRESPAALYLKSESRTLPIPTHNVAAIVFNPSLAAKPRATGLHALVGFDDGSDFNVQRFESDGSQVQVHLIGGVILMAEYKTFSPSQTEAGQDFWQHVELVQPWSPRVTYLSELKPLGYKHIPFLDVEWPYQADRNVLGGRLRVGGRLFTKGLGVHSTSRLAYRLDGKYRRFQAALAIDDSADRGGSVTFRVFLHDAAGQWKVAYQSPMVRGGDRPLPISVDLDDARAIALIADFADRGDVLDHANWLNARFVK